MEQFHRNNVPGNLRVRILVAGLVAVILALAAVLGFHLLIRLSAPARAVAVRGTQPAGVDGVPRQLRVLTWNIAHGRGAASRGWLDSWVSQPPASRTARLARIASVVRSADADVVVLNEVDFDATWSGGVNQAQVVSRRAGYPVRVEQRNVEVRLPGLDLVFGNALLSRLPVRDVQSLRLPALSGAERMLLGAKTAAVVRLSLGEGCIDVVPIHLEHRSEEVRLAALPLLQQLRATAPCPVILAGDFNSTPEDWPEATPVQGRTLLGSLLGSGWRIAEGDGDDEGSLTFRHGAYRRAIDWVVVEPPLGVSRCEVLQEVGLSDHAPVLATVRLPPVDTTTR